MSILDDWFGETVLTPGVQRSPPYHSALANKNYVAAVPLLKQAAERDDPVAMGILAGLYSLGRGVEKSYTEAYAWFRRSATLGEVKAQLALGICLATGAGTPIDKVEAAYWLYRAGRAGNLEAIATLGDLADQDHSVVGPHFSEEELIDLVYRFRNQLVRKIQAFRSPGRVPASMTVH